eukprot:GILK01013794.1.p1 GENE.GILK01013794.1~~GILK01013794.1.p1  ORF type:complete len:473 (-),score=108.47 GILK01013794.1:159-1577(-)
MIKSYDGDKTTLGDAEKYFVELISIPKLSDRLDAFIFKLRFQQLVDELGKNLAIVRGALGEVKRSQKLKRVFEVILALGNYLNGGSARGQAYGFKLDSLNKLSEVKSTDNKKSLMMYLAAYLETKEKNVYDFNSDLTRVEEAARVGFQQLQQDLHQVKSGTKIAQRVVEHQSSHPLDKLKVVLEPFALKASQVAEQLDRDLALLQKDYEDLCKFYCEDPKKLPSEEFFKIFYDFKTSYERARDENVRQKEAAEAAAKKAKMQEEADAKKKKEVVPASSSKQQQAGVEDVEKQGKENIVENIFGTLKAGDAGAIVDLMKQRRQKNKSTINPSGSPHRRTHTSDVADGSSSSSAHERSLTSVPSNYRISSPSNAAAKMAAVQAVRQAQMANSPKSVRKPLGVSKGRSSMDDCLRSEVSKPPPMRSAVAGAIQRPLIEPGELPSKPSEIKRALGNQIVMGMRPPAPPSAARHNQA